MINIPAARTGPVILCIDDDPAIPIGIGLRLQSFNVQVITAYFGQQGIWLAVTAHPDLVITDLRMPQGQGRYVVECLRGRPETRDVPVVVLTGSRDPERQRQMRALGVEHYLVKPVDPTDLLAALKTYIQLDERAPQ